MKSKISNTNNLTWESSLLELSPRKSNQSLLKIFDSGIHTIKDLLWIFPLRVLKAPELASFQNISVDSLFLGKAKIINIKLSPSYGRRGKKNIQLFNATVVVKDMLSDNYINLKWFNAYPGLKKQLEQLEEFTFQGVATDFKGTIQVINPKINPQEIYENGVIIEYPTVNSVAGNNLKKIFDKIPDILWETPIPSYITHLSIPQVTSSEQLDLLTSFKILHGKLGAVSMELKTHAENRLIYEEFLIDQLKVLARKMAIKAKDSPCFKTSSLDLEKLKAIFPYELTIDQNTCMNDIIEDFNAGHPMMRIIQGDVGCGKTTIAILAAILAIKNGYQVAIMCPTEQLARQHSKTFQQVATSLNISHELLLGSTKTKHKNFIYQQLSSGTLRLVIGTHSLIQDSVNFNNLGLCIIDEQHKFGVEQRLRLVNKGIGTHCLIMTATPIPRTLQLAQYGDLDISSIRTIPQGRKGIKTRIVRENNYQNYLSFIKTRISIGEQVYVVVPAISESILDLRNVDEHESLYKNFFPELKINSLHGQLKAEEKQHIMDQFNQGNIDILISTSVIEVGINVPNATVMTIYNPDRFGLSSLHQLRGRVGRGSKPGFCFLICDNNISNEALNRLRVIEKTNDGFEIAEADLKIRGEGDLFGVDQSGNVNNKKLASIFHHYDIFEKAINDINQLKDLPNSTLWHTLKHFTLDEKITTTI